ncbi:helix-turn-helix domain-containing protein [Bifidobacterium pseudolongum]
MRRLAGLLRDGWSATQLTAALGVSRHTTKKWIHRFSSAERTAL